jgi:myosin heavy subunit
MWFLSWLFGRRGDDDIQRAWRRIRKEKQLIDEEWRRIDEERERLRKKQRELLEDEDRLTELARKLKEISSKLKEEKRKLKQDRADFQRREVEISKKENDLRRIEEELKLKAEEISKYSEELKRKEDELKRREEELVERERKLAEWEKDLKRREEGLDKAAVVIKRELPVRIKITGQIESQLYAVINFEIDTEYMGLIRTEIYPYLKNTEYKITDDGFYWKFRIRSSSAAKIVEPSDPKWFQVIRWLEDNRVVLKRSEYAVVLDTSGIAGWDIKEENVGDDFKIRNICETYRNSGFAEVEVMVGESAQRNENEEEIPF